MLFDSHQILPNLRSCSFSSRVNNKAHSFNKCMTHAGFSRLTQIFIKHLARNLSESTKLQFHTTKKYQNKRPNCSSCVCAFIPPYSVIVLSFIRLNLRKSDHSQTSTYLQKFIQIMGRFSSLLKIIFLAF